ncbi:MAG: 30S ribosomal protein S9 [Candidatus Niyogibacteria bacterium]|nr:30S ribosomal protein S9 [Candidatus Niyogibacteria bacterium]
MTAETKTKKPAVKKSAVKHNYIEAVGRRKTSIARVRLEEGAKTFTINGKKHADYFPTIEMQSIVEGALKKVDLLGKYGVSAHVYGGGIHSQAEAVRHGMARALEKIDPAFRAPLKEVGFFKRDPRAKERRKFGLKKARKAPQWSKR